MKKKNWILPGLVVILMAAYFLMVGFSPRAAAQIEKSTCCTKKMKNCEGRNNSATPGDIILENFSRQFLIISSFGY
jgi:hypothetical protein